MNIEEKKGARCAFRMTSSLQYQRYKHHHPCTLLLCNEKMGNKSRIFLGQHKKLYAKYIQNDIYSIE